ncbi:hypothetical protein EON77_21750 [bacterium]|nr:MAG: hypothetical protein EON77_21750 [bacterium]
MPPLLLIAIGFLLAFPLAFRFARRRRSVPHRAEFWIYSNSKELLTAGSLKTAVGSLPGDLLGSEEIDLWTFTDVRWRLGDGDRRTLPHAFDPQILGVGLREAEEITRSDRITKILFVGDVGLEGFPLATVTAAALAAARTLGATLIWDHVARRAWIPRDLATAVKRDGIVSPEVQLHHRWFDDGAHGVLRVLGFGKRGRHDLETLPVPTDFRVVAEATTDAYARHVWTGETAPFSHEAYGDTFQVAARSGGRVTRVRIFRRRNG